MAFTTRKSLLAKVRAGDEVSWAEFYAAYKPLILLCGEDCMLTPDENDELVQQVMSEIFRKDIVGKYDPDFVPRDVVFHYDPKRGRFRHYLRKIIRNQALKIYRKRNGFAGTDDGETPPAEPSVDVWNELWDEEWKRHALAMALAELKGHVQPATYVAFEMYVLQERPVREVADFLGISVASVYTAKSRCIAALKEIISKLEEP
jgi:RNA polymerase sigma factor (sigma-70 family)